jgi:chromosome segregation ATPase
MINRLVLLLITCFLCLANPSRAAAPEEDKTKPDQEGVAKPKAKRVYTNEDLKRLKETTRINQVEETGRASRGSEKRVTAGGIENHRDIHGHDRTYWQQKIRPLRNQLATLDARIAVLQQRRNHLNAASGIKVTRTGKLKTSSSDTRAQLTKQIDDLEAKRAETLRAIESTEEDARKAQALPGWLR